MKRQRSIAGRATTCWKGRVGAGEPSDQLVIKDSWEYEERPEEGLLLQEATDAGVENVARYYHHETVCFGGAVDDVLRSIRKGLNDDDGRNPFERRRTRLYDTLAGAAASGSSGQEMGGGGSRGGSRGRAKSRSNDVSRKRSSSQAGGPMPPPKRTCSDSLVDSLRRRNRVHRRVIMRDVGKSLYQASNLRALLTGLLGGIRHESLLSKAKILQRDISIGNVMLNEAEDDGFLIDYDLAVKIDREKASGAPSKTGTKVFMAIGPLYGEEHMDIHDKESFFWLLFWIGCHWNGPNQIPRGSEYDSWNRDPTEKIAREKTGLILEEDKFVKGVNENFTDYCRPLITCIRELRKVVFPDGKRRMVEDPALYHQIKAVLERTIEKLRD